MRYLLLLVLAGCPESDDTTDYVYECPMVHGAPFALGTDLGDSWYRDGVSSMVPNTTQLMTVGRYHDNTNDVSGHFDVDVIGARGVDLARVGENQFLLRAGDEGSACLQLRDASGDITNVPLYVASPLRTFVTAPGIERDPVYLYGTRATIALENGGGWRIVDSGLQFVHGPRVYPTEKWDTVTLVELGKVPLDIVTSDGRATTLVLDVVAKPDAFVVSWPKEMPSVLLAGSETQFCMYPTYEGRYVANAEWKWTVTNANWTTSNGLGQDVPGCVRVTPTAPGHVEITADVSGATKTLAFDVQ